MILNQLFAKLSLKVCVYSSEEAISSINSREEVEMARILGKKQKATEENGGGDKGKERVASSGSTLVHIIRKEGEVRC